jgi:hypothetical protein
VDQFIKWATTGDNFWWIIIALPIIFTGIIKIIKACRGDAVEEE